MKTRQLIQPLAQPLAQPLTQVLTQPLTNNRKIEFFDRPHLGTVSTPITRQQPGRIQALASYWPAQLYDPDDSRTLQPDEVVMVVARQGITLLVMPQT